MGVGIDLSRRTMGCPTDMADANAAGQWTGLNHFLQISEFAFGPSAVNIAVNKGGNPG